MKVTVQPSPEVSITKDNDIDCSVHTVQLRANGAFEYEWLPEAGLSNSKSPDPIGSIGSTTTDYVKGIASNGRYNYDSITAKVTATGANSFFVPKAFSPNGDGYNDCIGVKRWGDVHLEEMAIYDRWGVRVYRAIGRLCICHQSHDFLWDGHKDGSGDADTVRYSINR